MCRTNRRGCGNSSGQALSGTWSGKFTELAHCSGHEADILAPRMSKPLVVAIEMGYGHLRAAEPIARLLGTEVLHADRPPLADTEEQRLWREARRAYEFG